MKTSFETRALPALMLALCLPVCVAIAPGQKAPTRDSKVDSPIGVWRGDSVCATSPPPCNDEKVVYYIEAIEDKPDAMNIRADKIVDGKPITMGSGPWKYDKAKQTLSMETAQRVWLLKISGKHIRGTLTESGDVVFRRMTLTKDD